MTFLMPAVLLVGAIGTLAAVALHFLSVRKPPVMLLPTARFIGARDVRAVSRSARPSDLLLLLLRVLALWCAAVALAGPRWTGGARVTGHVIVADAVLRADSARIATRVGVSRGAPVRFAWSDSAAGMRAELGAAWPLAWRATSAMLREVAALDSVALHVVAPSSSESFDGWSAWRRTWPGKVTVREMKATGVDATGAEATGDAATRDLASRDSMARAAVRVVGGVSDDVVRAAFDVHISRVTNVNVPAQDAATTASIGNGVSSNAPSAPIASSAAVRSVRVLRGTVAEGRSDGAAGSASGRASATASDAAGSVIVYWPTDGIPAGWTAAHDTVGAVIAGNDAIVAPWVRSAVPPSNAVASGSNAHAIAWWSDGVPAAIERTNANGSDCTREVGIAVPNGSDVLLPPAARSLIAAIAAPCGRAGLRMPRYVIEDSGGTRSLPSAAALRSRLAVSDAVSPRWLPAALLAGALVLLLLESAVRRAGDDGDSVETAP